MLLYANGCSYTFGHGLTDRDISADPDSWGSARDLDYARSHSWPKLAADRLGWDCYNDALPGGSNDRIVRTTLSFLSRQHRQDLFVIIGWTRSARREIYFSESDIYVDLSALREVNIARLYRLLAVDNNEAARMTDTVMRYGWDFIESHMRYCSQVLLLSSYLQQRRIPYLFCNTLGESSDTDSSWLSSRYSNDAGDLHRSINWNDFVSYDGSTDNVLHRFCQNLPDDQFDCTLHPTQAGHDAFAELVYREILSRRSVSNAH